ncbi:zinc-binding dehydrogenase [Kribbella sandramycini]|uniref:NADPH2:quinone reductase n=1 Tax=Kribbella sandramycini TaxID=60450 RepID=A0A7Y4KYM6_9ACTN|nr:zinc-binding dehydrogenase [Kribbella sandramycini]MBB6569107.1 NADPH2:quinone reductase [Kribbella sandramycini]NOL41050.1 zinc-binding dehydrogenase [Kribbella sandramycini]
MKTIRLHAFGPPENLRYEDVADPVPGPGTVLLQVEAAGVHLLDTFLRAGDFDGTAFTAPDLPTIPGREVAGVVRALGPDADPSWLGKRVVVHLGMVPGGYAELAVAKVESLYELPDHVDGVQAVAAIGTGRTTAGILAQAALSPDDVVLITSAAGGIGSYLVQAARNAGATVIGVAGGPAKVQLVRELGAHYAADYQDPNWVSALRTDLAPAERPVTVMLDGVAGESGRQALELVADGGRVLTFGWSGGDPLPVDSPVLSTRGITVTAALGDVRARLREFERIALDETIEGRWRALSTTFPLSDAATAHRALEERRAVGKVVLVP